MKSIRGYGQQNKGISHYICQLLIPSAEFSIITCVPCIECLETCFYLPPDTSPPPLPPQCYSPPKRVKSLKATHVIGYPTADMNWCRIHGTEWESHGFWASSIAQTNHFHRVRNPSYFFER